MNTFGRFFRFTTWGESHGAAIGVVVDGCPAGLHLTAEMVQQQLDLRAPGRLPWTSPRREQDQVMIQSGVFEHHTTGAPIAMIIGNHDANSAAYSHISNTLRPGHANYTYIKKYGHVDQRGGGRASARETACRVMAGAVAKALLATQNIEVVAGLAQLGALALDHQQPFDRSAVYSSPVYCPDPELSQLMIAELKRYKSAGDSIGGAVAFQVSGCPIGLGEPIYGKCEAMLAQAMMSLPASKGFEIGSGFEAVALTGSAHNDGFHSDQGQITLSSNNAGGILGGLTSGERIWGRVAFKPTSSIAQPQATTTISGVSTTLDLGPKARHDPCVAIRAVPVVEAMAACVVADLWLQAQPQQTFVIQQQACQPNHS